ncbi:3-phosphoshikimate 1-carboxyvinyltransferase [Galactobacter caseinivorans]|uniref:3-phosphoshikimate 1-carboxyvinyltransferase n=1 Tax=Galactobacter caseinivorans TaxID=2676123 RepID=A0A496PMW6_9MICC|nr:3-phosphoshikimate 1-carboxyvinyltransferase [Galactobacter caseinivorans]RKW71806.1 3-phosphoshikimate 1-carboxyvinyltransferase [Galactobacter caseinivorans]
MTSVSSVPLDPWPAPVSPGPLNATVNLPGSKSLTNRHLVLAALAGAPSQVVAPLDSRDTRLMVRALEQLGARIKQGTDSDGVPVWTVTPFTLPDAAGSPLAAGSPGEGSVQGVGSPAPVEIDCGLAGTVMRFVPAVAALTQRPVRLDGDPAARRRPMGPVIQALKALGVEVHGGEDGHLPFTVTGSAAVRGGRIEVDASGSSQFVSALLLAGSRFPEGIHVRHTGAVLPSPQHIEMTMVTLRGAGLRASTDPDGLGWRVEPGVPSPGDVTVEPDLSNAGPFLGAALVCGGTVRVPRWPAKTTQIGALWTQLLPRMGAQVHLTQDGTLEVTGTGHLTAVDAADTGELAPTLAALCALAQGTSRLTGLAHLRGHETDRLAALVTELGRVNVAARELPDGLEISPEPGAAHGAVWESYEDHRIATAGALMGLAVPGVQVVDVATTAKTLPGFVGMWEGMLASHAGAAQPAGVPA